MKVLFLTPELPWPADSGGRIKSWKLVEHLGERYQLDVACLLKDAATRHAVEFRDRAPINNLDAVEIDAARTVGKVLKSFARGRPVNVVRNHSQSLQARIRSTVHRYDLVFVDHYEMMQYVPDDHDGPVILHQHNAYYQLWRSYAGRGRGMLKRLFAALESVRVARYERRVCSRADLVFAAPNDMQKLADIGVPRSRMEETLHLGNRSHLEQPDIDWRGTAESVLYVGHLRWEPNVQGLLWYLEEVWPMIVAALSDARLDIVGADPDPRLVAAVSQARRVSLAGYQEDLEPWMRRSRVLAAPLLVGSGIKVKVLTGMARGLPTVTTPTGVEGLELGTGRAVLVSSDAEQMATDTVSLLTDRAAWHAVRRASRELIRSRYTWDIVLSRMQREIDRVLAQPSRPATHAAPEAAAPAPLPQGGVA